MKGLVFTEFLEMVESAHGMDTTDQLLDIPTLESGGAYTSVGTYDAGELVEMVVLLSELIEQPIDDLLVAFGEYLFVRFHALFPTMFAGKANSREFLMSIHGHIHVEVRKLYPEADLPNFDAQPDDEGLTLKYSSKRPFAMFALGLIRGCLSHFDNGELAAFELTGNMDGCEATFRIQ